MPAVASDDQKIGAIQNETEQLQKKTKTEITSSTSPSVIITKRCLVPSCNLPAAASCCCKAKTMAKAAFWSRNELLTPDAAGVCTFRNDAALALAA
mmetsp:Transcript_13132/g.15995  ORF Transcript_13132/g.15995 Transcript_13132/m.15995 type:complete len:96 (-) Transcript_13132:502-789(-)